MKLFIGQKIKMSIKGHIIIGEITEIEKEFIIAKSEGQRYKIYRDKMITFEKEYDNELSCRNCMEYKIGNCIGLPYVCEDYRNAPIISIEEMNRWPKEGSASRTKSNNYIVRESYKEYSNYH